VVSSVGIEHIKEKRIAHVTEAFAEDPLRVYRVARFAAKLPDFTVDKSTVKLMTSLKDELHTLSPERVWGELEKALRAPAPWRFFEVLKDANLLELHFEPFHRLIGVTAGPEEFHGDEKDTFEHTMNVVKWLKDRHPYLVFAALCHDLGKGETPHMELPHHYGHDVRGEDSVYYLCRTLKTPNSYRIAGLLGARHHMRAGGILDMRPSTAIKMLSDLMKFPHNGVIGFFELVHADGRHHNTKLPVFVKEILNVFNEKLPEKYQGMGQISGQILLQIRVAKYKEIKKEIIDDNLYYSG